MAALISFVSGLGVLLEYHWNTNAPLSAVVPAVATISFIGLLVLTQPDSQRWQVTESSLRSAIAGTIVITYLVLVGIVAFFVVGPKELPAISQTMVSNFTTVVGVVIAFYFGASAYVQARSKDETLKHDTKEGPKSNREDRID